MEKKIIRPVLSIALYTDDVKESKKLFGEDFFFTENNKLNYGLNEVFRMNDGDNIMNIIYLEDKPIINSVVKLYLDEYLQLGKYQFDLGNNRIGFEGSYSFNGIPFEAVDYDLEWIDVILNGSLDNIIEHHVGLNTLLQILRFYDEGDQLPIREVTDYCDIADYISTKTLVELPEGKTGNEPITWQQLGGITFDNLKKDVKYNKETLYYDDLAKPVRLIHGEYLLELILNYKLNIHGSRSINWRQIDGSPEYRDPKFNPILAPISGTPDDMKFDDGLGMITKLNYIKTKTTIEDGVEVEEDEKIPITWNGFHVTSGNLAEYTFAVRAHAIPGYIKLSDLFVLEISEDSIIVYPINGDVQEYFIASCKIICKPLLEQP